MLTLPALHTLILPFLHASFYLFFLMFLILFSTLKFQLEYNIHPIEISVALWNKIHFLFLSVTTTIKFWVHNNDIMLFILHEVIYVVVIYVFFFFLVAVGKNRYFSFFLKVGWLSRNTLSSLKYVFHFKCRKLNATNLLKAIFLLRFVPSSIFFFF